MGIAYNLQKALYAAVVAAVPTAVKVYDDVPDNAVEPFVRIGEMTAVPWDTDSSFGSEDTVTIHSWSVYRGAKEVKDIMSVIKAALHEQDLSAFGLKIVMVVLEYTEVIVESDGLTRHGVQRFRILMEES